MNEAELAKMIADAQRRRSYVTLLELLDHYLANYPPTGVYHYLRAEALRALGRLDEAEAELLKATAPSDKQYLIHLALGMIYEVKGKLADAEAQFRAAVESRKNFTSPFVFLAKCLMGQQRHNEARQTLNDALSLEGDRDEVMLNLAYSYRATGDYGEARQWLIKALAIDPAYQVAREALDDIERALSVRASLVEART